MPYYDITIMAQAWCPFIHESKLLQIMFMPHFDANYFIDKLLADIGSQTWDIDLNNSVSNYKTMYDLKLKWFLGVRSVKTFFHLTFYLKSLKRQIYLVLGSPKTNYTS